MRQELENVLRLAKNLHSSELPEFLGELERVRITALARIISPTIEARPDSLLTVDQTSKRMNVSADYLYRNARRLPFTRRVGRKLLFSSSGLDAYLRRSR